MLAEAAGADPPNFYRRLFENGVRLGEGFRRHHRQTVALDEIPDVLNQLGTRCLGGGRWQSAGARAWRLERSPCVTACSATLCDAWREAIDGLVSGLSSGARHARTASLGHGQARCVDLVYEGPENPLRFGELENDLIASLESVQRFVRCFRGADVRFLGVSEGVLVYQFDCGACEAQAGPARQQLEQLLQRKLPHLRVCEISPRAVLAGELHHE